MPRESTLEKNVTKITRIKLDDQMWRLPVSKWKKAKEILSKPPEREAGKERGITNSRHVDSWVEEVLREKNTSSTTWTTTRKKASIQNCCNKPTDRQTRYKSKGQVSTKSPAKTEDSRKMLAIKERLARKKRCRWNETKLEDHRLDKKLKTDEKTTQTSKRDERSLDVARKEKTNRLWWHWTNARNCWRNTRWINDHSHVRRNAHSFVVTAWFGAEEC